MDVVKVLLDFESEEALAAADADRDRHLFYCCLGAAYGLMASMVSKTTALQKYLLGPLAYFLNVYRDIANKARWTFDVEVDGGRRRQKGMVTQGFKFGNY